MHIYFPCIKESTTRILCATWVIQAKSREQDSLVALLALVKGHSKMYFYKLD